MKSDLCSLKCYIIIKYIYFCHINTLTHINHHYRIKPFKICSKVYFTPLWLVKSKTMPFLLYIEKIASLLNFPIFFEHKMQKHNTENAYSIHRVINKTNSIKTPDIYLINSLDMCWIYKYRENVFRAILVYTTF